MSNFESLHPSLQHHVVNTLGWSSLRPLQEQAIEPVSAGHDALLLAPTAGGKTEAVTFPLLSTMANEDWDGLSVLYVCPLKALLNNLQPRLDEYAARVGRTVATRHGDTPAGERRRQVLDPPSILLTTPESIEAALTSTLVDEARFFAGVRTVVIDEVHAFAGDDRGWHLLAVMDRLEQLTGRRIQRVGLSATVGNPSGLLTWLQGRDATKREGSVVAPAAEGARAPEFVLDYVGSMTNAARVIGAMHRGEKRLAFCDSRRIVEGVSGALREMNVETFVSHSSLALGERRRAESAFAEASDCVIVSTSTLELGIDVGDLDRVIQVGAPTTVASLLQRLGRTGRRTGTRRNMMFLAMDDFQLLRSTALLILLEEGFVEPIKATAMPLHIVAQQILAQALQSGRVTLAEQRWMYELGMACDADVRRIWQWLIDTEHLDLDGGLAFVGPRAERRYGGKHFLELLAVFSAAPEMTVLQGREEIGSLDPKLFLVKTEGPRIIGLAGRSWQVNHIDWKRQRVFVEPSEQRGRSLWSGATAAYSFELTQAIRRVLLGGRPTGVQLSERAVTRLEQIRDEYQLRVASAATVVRDEGSQRRWWTFAGFGTNATLSAALRDVRPDLVDEEQYDNFWIRLRPDVTAAEVRSALDMAYERFGPMLEGVVPAVGETALSELKFSEMLPPDLARRALAARITDPATVHPRISRP